MNKLFRNFLLGFTLPCIAVTGAPRKWKTCSYKREAPKDLKFNEDGKFKILHLTDIHECEPCMDDEENRQIPIDKTIETINVIEELVKRTEPDLVVFGGDNINGFQPEFTYDFVQSCIERITEPIRKRNIPLAVVFGNHDGEAGFHLEFQMLQYMEYENCRSNLNDEDVYGCGNCCVTIKGSKDNRDAYSIFLIDSNDYQLLPNGKDRGYDIVHPDQIQWYEKRSRELQKENGGEPLPALVFQHMPVQQEYDYIREAKVGEEPHFQSDGKGYVMDNIIEGRLREGPCPPWMGREAREQFDSWVKMGNVKAAFFGHDHTNDFRINIDGIDLYQTLGVGYHSYGKERGGRLIVLDENNPDNVVTESLEVKRITKTEF